MSNYIKRILVSLIAIFYFGLSSGQEYHRIISLAPSLTKSIYYLESKDKLIGCTSYCEIAKPDNKDIIATAIKVNLEQAVKLKPDIVIATGITNPETLEFFRKFGIKTEVFETPETFSEICNQFTRLGELVNKQSLASSIITKSTSKVDSLKNLYKWEDPPKIFIQIGAKPLFAVTANNFMNDYIKKMGGVNVAAELKRGTVSREYILAQNPDIVIIVTMGIVGEEEKRIWKSYKSLSASKSKHIYIIDSNIACTPTPISFTETLGIIFNLIN